MTNRNPYPANWPELARACKARANWQCEQCGIRQHTIAVSRRGTPYIVYLGAAHVNHDKGNPDPELKALCISCHAKLDYQRKQRERQVRLEVMKHLKRLIEQGIVEAIAYI